MTMVNALSEPASDAEITAWWQVLAAAQAADLPHLPDVPAPTRDEIAGRLRVPSVRGRIAHWTARTDEGVAALILPSDEGNTHTAFLDVLAVRPHARRRGVGTALWRRVHEELLAEDRTSVATVTELGGAGQAFAESLGFENVLALAWYVRELPREPAPVPATPGYEIHTWHGVLPDAWAPAAAEAHMAMEDAPSGDMDERIQAWTPERVQAAQRLVVDRGGEHTMVAAVTPAGEVAAYTVLVLPDPAGPRGLQYDTVVVPAHRGHGLGRAVKLHMQAAAAERHPALRRIGTTVADENTPMLAVNEALGYRRERPVAVFQRKV
ncbi:GNAT family N-acetyltransferase [Streptomyces sp. NPDC003042]